NFHIRRVAGQELSGGSYDLCFDAQGRLLVGDGNAVRRLNDNDNDGAYDGYEVIATGLGPRGPQGLLVWGDRLYAVGGDGLQLFEGYESGGPLVHRGRLGAKLNTGGDHDAHTIFRGADDHIYLMAGNGSGIRDRLHITESNSPGIFEREASVFRISPDGKKWECIASGGRNPPSLGMNYLGELFSFDSDMEWHVGLPWYRPVRLNHWTIGGDQGWQEVGAYPPYYIDNLPGILDVGRGSPNWGVFYEADLLPQKYRDAFLVCDYRWKRESNDQYSTSGRLIAFFMKRKGAGWTASMETLARPKPNARDANGKRISFALVDIAIAPDGSLYLSDHNQGIWRITCEPQTLNPLRGTLSSWERRATEARRLGQLGDIPGLLKFLADDDPFVRRRAAEELTRWPVPEARGPLIEALNDPERLVRYVAMCALAHHPISEWLDQALARPYPQTQMRALVVGMLRREQVPADKAQKTIRALLSQKLSVEDQLDLLRVIHLFPARNAGNFLLSDFPDADRNVRWEKIRLMGEFRIAEAFPLLLRELESETNHVTQFHIAQAIARLRQGWNTDQETRLLNWFLETQEGWFAQFSGKGVEFPAFWQTTLSEFAANHRDAFMRASNRIQLTSLMGNVLINSLGPAELTAMYKAENSPDVKKKIVKALKRIPGAEVPITESQAAPLRAEKSDEDIHKFILAAKGGDAQRGGKVYEALQCNSCHGGGVTPGREGRFFGPDLAGIGQRLTKTELADALVYPSKQVADRFKGVEIEFADATPLTGFITDQDAETITLADRDQVQRVPRSKIRAINPQSSSLMPSKLLNQLSEDELRDLLAFLADGR
ncbi:MAG TPA: HEAT repeat domain-containing protein, partial [Verrucomicrobiae bacterium]|nr:HEAT repeat domain-containing protein [Verrucomicrobiae bacterium]